MGNKEIAMMMGNSTFAGRGTAGLRTLMIAAVSALCVTGALAGPSGQAGKVIAKGTTKVVVRKTVEEAAERAAREAAEKVAKEVAAKAAREAAERAARKAAGKELGIQIVKQLSRPKAILAMGAGTAMVVGSHNASAGVRHAAEDVGKGVRDVAENHPDILHEVIREGGRPIIAFSTMVCFVIGLCIALVALWVTWPIAWPFILRIRRRLSAIAPRNILDSRNPRLDDGNALAEEPAAAIGAPVPADGVEGRAA